MMHVAELVRCHPASSRSTRLNPTAINSAATAIATFQFDHPGQIPETLSSLISIHAFCHEFAGPTIPVWVNTNRIFRECFFAKISSRTTMLYGPSDESNLLRPCPCGRGLTDSALAIPQAAPPAFWVQWVFTVRHAKRIRPPSIGCESVFR